MLEETISINQLRKKSVVMLFDIKNSLDKWNVTYWLDFGSLLGAFRSGKSMPWDGDFDLSTLDLDINKKEGLWQELKKKGYLLDFSHSNIKIIKNDWRIGQYRLDLHRYHTNEKDDAEYEYGRKYVRKIDFFLNNFIQVLDFLMVPNIKSKIKYPTFGILCRLLLQNGVDPNELETLEPFKVIKGKFNSHYDLVIQTSQVEIFSSPLQRLTKSSKLFYHIIKISPNFLITGLFSLLNNHLLRSPKIPSRRVFFPKRFYNAFTPIDFFGMKFNAPSPTEEYLERIYGNNWKTPLVTKNKKYLNRITYKK